MNTADTKPCIEDNEHRATQRHTALECPANDDLREALNISSPNATVTVTYKGKSVTFDLDGTELSEGVHLGHPGIPAFYLTNASKGFISDEVEKALITVATSEVSA
jgi:hypothetical protein